MATKGNVKPTAVISGDANANQYDRVCLSAEESTDPNANDYIVNYHWEIIAPDGSPCKLTQYNEVNVCFDADQPGDYAVKLVVNDGQLESNVAESSVNVGENGKPSAVINNETQNVDLGNEVCLDGSSSSDPEDDDLNYEWNIIVAPDGSSIVPFVSDLKQACFTPDVIGDYVVQLIVTDEHENQSEPLTITIAVNEEQIVPPVVNDLEIYSNTRQIQLTWTHVGSESYNIYRKIEDGDYRFLANSTSTYSVYQDLNVSRSVNYTYKVTSVDNEAEGEFSNEVTGKLKERTRR